MNDNYENSNGKHSGQMDSDNLGDKYVDDIINEVLDEETPPVGNPDPRQNVTPTESTNFTDNSEIANSNTDLSDSNLGNGVLDNTTNSSKSINLHKGDLWVNQGNSTNDIVAMPMEDKVEEGIVSTERDKLSVTDSSPKDDGGSKLEELAKEGPIFTDKERQYVPLDDEDSDGDNENKEDGTILENGVLALGIGPNNLGLTNGANGIGGIGRV